MNIQEARGIIEEALVGQIVNGEVIQSIRERTDDFSVTSSGWHFAALTEAGNDYCFLSIYANDPVIEEVDDLANITPEQLQLRAISLLNGHNQFIAWMNSRSI